MNKAAALVSESLIGNSFTTFFLGGRAFTVYPPTIKVICRAISCFSKIGLNGEYTRTTVIAELPENAPHIVKGLAALIVGDVNCWKWRAKKVEKILESATLEELKLATESIIPLIGGADFFDIAVSLKSVSAMAAKAK